MKAEDSSTPANKIKWTVDFISTLKLLLEGGANPIWIPDKLLLLEEYVHHSAQYQFFEKVFFVLVTYHNLFNQLVEVIKLFLSVTFPHDNHQTTILHTLATVPWKWIGEKHPDLSPMLFQQYCHIISTVIDCDPVIVDETSIYGRTALHQLFYEIKLINHHKNGIRYACDLSAPLFSKKNVNMQDNEGKTVLHYVAEAFPILDKPISAEDQIAFMTVVAKLSSSSSNVIQDKFGRTPLHTLIAKYSRMIPEHCCDIFCELVKILASPANVDIPDNNKQTAMHILAIKFAEETIEPGQILLLQLLKDLVLQSNNCIQDYQGHTVLHLLVKNFKQKVSEKSAKLLNEVILVLASPLTANIQNTLGQTALHELANKVYEHPDLGHQLLPLLPTLITSQNVNMKDSNSVTPYTWIIGGKLVCGFDDLNSKEIFTQFEHYMVNAGADADVARLGFPVVQ